MVSSSPSNSITDTRARTPWRCGTAKQLLVGLAAMVWIGATASCAGSDCHEPKVPVPERAPAPGVPSPVDLEPVAESAAPEHDDGRDQLTWLEQVDGEAALDWVRGQNQRTAERLTQTPLFAALHADARAVLNSASRIPGVTIRGKQLYNLWRDADHPRGIYRRTTLREYQRAQPKWQTVLDIDALADREGVKWVFKGISCLPETHRQCLVYLSPGGEDAVEVREFDGEKLAFVADGFHLDQAKSSLTWLDADTLIVGSDFGPDSLTQAGYPRILKRWRRGTPLADAAIVFSAEKSDGRVSARRMRSMGGSIVVIEETISFWARKYFQLVDGETRRLALPETAEISGLSGGKLVFTLEDDWRVGEQLFTRGSVLVATPESLTGPTPGAQLLLEPGAHEVVQSVHADDDAVIVTYLEDVRGRVDRFTPRGSGWKRSNIGFPDNGSLSVTSVDDDSGEMFVQFESFTTAPALYHVAGPKWQARKVKTQDATFVGDKFVSHQYWVQSSDGTRVPYFVVMAADAKLDGNNPTHIFGYGGFRVALTPSYSGSYEDLFGAYGKLWLERGGVFVLANLRGGSEFGPAWHAGVLREQRARVFEDLEAIAGDLVARKITSPEHLGIEGRSNGGLLVAAAMTRRPELYGAVICGVPLTDMRRYHRLLAGELWIAEYGNPDVPEDWQFLRQYSPYHNVRSGVEYPATLFYTSTRDDRVHPAHARKMAAKMIELGHAIDYYENMEGGHGGSSTNDQLAYRIALTYAHLWTHLASGRP